VQHAEGRTGVNCPRCGTPVKARGPTEQWQQHYECDECWLAFELVRKKHWEPTAADPPGRLLHHTLTLRPGRPVTHDSFVYYREAMTKTVTELVAEEKVGRLKRQEICTAKLLEVVRSGVSASPRTRRGISQFYKDHKNIPLPAAGPTAAPATAPKDSAQKPT
jgi:hypothetical protein